MILYHNLEATEYCGTVVDQLFMMHHIWGMPGVAQFLNFFLINLKLTGDKCLLRSMPSKHVFVKASLLLFESEFFVYCGLLP